MTEICEVQGCDLDAKAFKGIFVRNLRYLVNASSQHPRFKREIKAARALLDQNMMGLMANASCVPTRSVEMLL